MNPIFYRKVKEKINKGIVDNVYFLISRDFYSIKSIISLLKATLALDINYTEIDAEKIEKSQDIINLCSTFPMMDTRRIVVINKLDFGKKDKMLKDIIKYIPNLPKSTTVVITHYHNNVRTNPEKNAKVKKLYALKNVCSAYDPEILIEDILDILKEKSLTLDKNILYLLKDINNLDVINNEISKLENLKDRSFENVKKIISNTSQNDIFNLTDAISLKDSKIALSILKELIAKGESEMGIVSMILRQFRMLYLCKTYSSISKWDIAKKIGSYPGIVERLLNQQRNFSTDQLTEGINLCLEFQLNTRQGKTTKDITDILLSIF